jgi:hypothetical protein
MNQKLPRVEHLKERSKDCCCSYCGGDLAVRRILYQTTAEYRIELYCDNCEKIEYGVPRALYDSAKAAIERLGFNYYPETQEGITRNQMNIAKLSQLTAWQLRYLGMIDDDRLKEGVEGSAQSMDANTIVSEEDLDELLKEVQAWSDQQSDSEE